MSSACDEDLGLTSIICMLVSMGQSDLPQHGLNCPYEVGRGLVRVDQTYNVMCRSGNTLYYYIMCRLGSMPYYHIMCRSGITLYYLLHYV
jgi:hypothetical protein